MTEIHQIAAMHPPRIILGVVHLQQHIIERLLDNNIQFTTSSAGVQIDTTSVTEKDSDTIQCAFEDTVGMLLPARIVHADTAILHGENVHIVYV